MKKLKECFKKIKQHMWDKMPKYGRILFYTILSFIIVMLVWGASIYGFFEW